MAALFARQAAERCLFTESMTPRRAWKPPNTGNTCSMVSAMVASCRSRSGGLLHTGFNKPKTCASSCWSFISAYLSNRCSSGPGSRVKHWITRTGFQEILNYGLEKPTGVSDYTPCDVELTGCCYSTISFNFKPHVEDVLNMLLSDITCVSLKSLTPTQ